MTAIEIPCIVHQPLKFLENRQLAIKQEVPWTNSDRLVFQISAYRPVSPAPSFVFFPIKCHISSNSNSGIELMR